MQLRGGGGGRDFASICLSPHAPKQPRLRQAAQHIHTACRSRHNACVVDVGKNLRENGVQMRERFEQDASEALRESKNETANLFERHKALREVGYPLVECRYVGGHSFRMLTKPSEKIENEGCDGREMAGDVVEHGAQGPAEYEKSTLCRPSHEGQDDDYEIVLEGVAGVG